MLTFLLKKEIETWVQALDAYDNQEFEESLRCFDQIADTSKILFNCGVIYATLGEHQKAVECYQRAVGLDRYLAIAYFQQGVSNFLLGDFEEALANFNDTLLYLRGNTSIDYEQLGLLFRLFSCEVLFNRGLCYIYLRQMNPGIQDLEYAAKEKVTSDHDVIDDAIRENADGYTVFSIPVGVLYRPNAAKVKNLKTKDYLGKARLVAASDRNQSSDHQWNPIAIDKEALQNREGVSFAASHLVRQNLSSRTRQQSEPPLNRNVFPPTPPPDDRSVSTASASGSQSAPGHHRSSSLRGARPPRLDLDRAGASLERRPSQHELSSTEKPRIGTTRTASEPRGPSSRQNNMRGYSQESSSRSSLPREQTGHRRNLSDTNPNQNFSPDQDYGHTDPYSSQRNLANTGWGRGSRHQPPQYIDEEEEYASDICNSTNPNDGAFELVAAPQAGPSQSTKQRRTRSPARYSRHTNPRRPDIQKFRTKVHAPDDTRYIMIGPKIDFGEFENRIREKFGFKHALKMKVQDDGDMITMVDQEDLDLLVSSAKEVARREGSEMGKIEIWVEERTMI
ncbi:Tetratricopeptide-like helical [Penicillium vulpinum]|uniref:Tetratricopeptide-like helical n=1 Tax=Penicillium vulpinum TaxID=29845 RepID=UPI002547EAC8|nr:Tetratricopeptide-like helical [Penicillium vulpinum]KAJ5963686.1 Tetratricopeptide-like helical [Penicillium vulpinum]